MSKVFKSGLRVPKKRPGGGDGFVYVRAGDTPEQHDLDAKDVEQHLKDGSPELGTNHDGPDSAPITVPPGEERDLAIDLAIVQLDQGNKKHWTASGIPRVKAIEEKAGFDITEAERDKAWQKVEEK